MTSGKRGICARIGVMWAIAALLFGYAAARPASAQVLYGSIVGTIQDQSGAVVPKAEITVTNKGTGLTRTTAADAAGRYSLLNVLAGTYDLKVSAAGFRTPTKPDVEISINTVTRVDMRLEVGAVSEQVTIAATAAVLQTDKSDVRHEITATAITQLPLPMYRNYQSLIDLVPGATPSDFQNNVVDTPARALTTPMNCACFCCAARSLLWTN